MVNGKPACRQAGWSIVNNRAGFTLMELVIALAIIAAVSTILIVSFTSSRQKANDTKRKSDLEAIRGALALYYADNGYYPSSQNTSPASQTMRLDFITQITNCSGISTACLVTKVYLNDIQTSYTNPVKIGSPDAHHYCYMGQISSGSLISAAGNDCNNTTIRCNHYRLFAVLDQPAGGTFHCNDGAGDHISVNYMVEP